MSELTTLLIGFAIALVIVFLVIMLCFSSKKTYEKRSVNEEVKNYQKKTIKFLTKEQIEEIHKKGFITPEEKLNELEGIGLCAPGDAIGSASWRCKLFGNCHDCLCDYVASKDKWEIFDFKLVNSIDIKDKDFYVQKLE